MCLAETHAAVRSSLDKTAEHDHPTGSAPGRLGRRQLLMGGGLAAASALLPTPALASPPRRPTPSRGRVADLTHTFTTDFPVFVPGEEATRRTHVTIEDNGYYLQEWTFYEHTATHMDAPGHFTPGGRLSPDITPEELMVPAVVVDIRRKAARNPDAEVTVADLRAFERRYGRIPERAAVLMASGWALKAGDPDAFLGTDASGTYHFPGFDLEAVEWLISRRNISSIGVDTVSLDHGPSATFEVHVALLGADRYGLESLRNLVDIPPIGATLFVGLVPWEEGSGGPCRVLAHW